MKFLDIIESLRANGRRARRVAVVQGLDAHTQEAVSRAEAEGLVQATYVSDDDPRVAAACAVEMVRRGEADFLMKGLLHTADLLRAILNKECGLLPAGRVLTHVAVAEIPVLERLLLLTDVAVIPYPTDEQRAQQVRAVVETAHALGIAEPRVALLHCAETVSEKFPHTLGYAALCERAQNGEFGKCIVDGPLDLRTAVDLEALQTKGIVSSLEGRADALVLPDIEAGNVLYKVLTFLVPGVRMAGMLVGASCPVILSSRGDSAETKYLSLAAAAAIT